MRIARTVQPNETIVNMFAGVGSFSILMAKHARVQTVYSIDVNPSAVKYMQENVRLNRVESKVVPILGDAKHVIVERLQNMVDRVVMPLPEKAYEYLDYAVMALKPLGGWVHYYDFEHASREQDPIEKVKTKMAEKLQKSGLELNVSLGRVVRPTGPNWYQVVLDLQLSPRKHLSEKVVKR